MSGWGEVRWNGVMGSDEGRCEVWVPTVDDFGCFLFFGVRVSELSLVSRAPGEDLTGSGEGH